MPTTRQHSIDFASSSLWSLVRLLSDPFRALFPRLLPQFCKIDLYIWMASSPALISVHLFNAYSYSLTCIHLARIDHSFPCDSQCYSHLQHQAYIMLLYFLFTQLNKRQLRARTLLCLSIFLVHEKVFYLFMMEGRIGSYYRSRVMPHSRERVTVNLFLT